jgi:hypothetical protein
MNFASIEMASPLTTSPLTAGPTLSRARLDKSLVDKARSLRASVAELLATAPEPPDGLGKANPAAAHTSRAAVRGLVLDLLDRESVALMASGRDPLPALDERTLVDLVLAMLFGLGLLQVFIDDEMVENISRCSDMGKLRIVQVSNVLPGHSVYHFCVSAKPWFESGTAFLAATGRWLLPDSRELPDRHSRAGAVGLAQGQSRHGLRPGAVPAGDPAEARNCEALRDLQCGRLFQGVRLRLPARKANTACIDAGGVGELGGIIL